ncbi:serine hydrolase [Aestuariivirga sp.]|uniref:serine hydrolase n=1 Tax=Aestuariivirga sp. TaxID=2650926 RepID=UPI00391BF62B
MQNSGIRAGTGVPEALSVIWRAMLLMLIIAVSTSLAAAPAAANAKFAAITVDARTGKVLFSENADSIRHPASLTKMMTLYVLFQDLKSGKLSLGTPIRMSKRAAGMAPSKLGVKAGGSISVETAIRALVVKSANDVAAAVAETLEGSESAFAKRMTRTARSLDMARTTFANASGLPNPAQVTTARDMATLGLRLMRDFPEYYPYFRSRSFVYGGRTIRGHNRLLGSYEGTDGIKTGYINASGFNLVSSVRRGDKRLVGVVLGGRTGASRDAYMKKMLSKQFGKATGGKTIAALAGSSKGVVASAERDETPAAAATVGEAQKAARKEAAAKNTKKTEQETQPAAEPEQGDAEGSMADLAAQAATELVEEVPQPSAMLTDIPAPGENQPGETPFQVKTPSEQLADKAAVASISPAVDSSWTINLGDYATKNDAQAVLQLLRKRSPDLLSGKTAQTVMVEKSGVVTYRARFTGFDEAAAALACKAAKKHKTPCQPQGPS